MRRSIVLIGLSLVVACKGSRREEDQLQQNDGIELASRRGEKNAVAKVSPCAGDSLTLASGARTCGWLRDAELIATLVVSPIDTFLLVSGWGCSDCDAEQEFVLRKLGDGRSAWRESRAGDFVAPGTSTDYEDDSRVVSKTRLYWGLCLDDIGPTVVQIDSLHQVGLDSVWLVIARPTRDSIRRHEEAAPSAVLSSIKARLAGDMCHEVPPRSGSSRP